MNKIECLKEIRQLLFLHFDENKNLYINLIDPIFDYNSFFKNIKKLSVVFFLMLIFIGLLISRNLTLLVILLFIVIFCFYKWWRYIGKMKIMCKEKNKHRFSMLDFLLNNKLYSEKSGVILSSAEFSIIENLDELIVIAHKNGDTYTRKLSDLDEELSSYVGVRVSQKIDRPTRIEYYFKLNEPTRLYVKSTGQKQYTNSQEVNLGYGFVYNPIKTPHILVAGGTGSGKSVFISFLIIEFLKKKSEIFIIDPKRSDLSQIGKYLKEGNVATTPFEIAKVIRLAKDEMLRRYEYMNSEENFKYGSNFVEHGFRQSWVIFDEIGAFAATATDKKSKEIVSEVMDGIKQLILLGRQAGVFILISGQQMRTENLSSELRDNLGLRLAFGSNSKAGYKMIFENAMPDILPPIEEKGAGLLFMQGSGQQECAQYYESPFIDIREFNFISELQLYIDNEKKQSSSQ